MSDAYRTHYQPAANQLLPGADPYIASLVQPMFLSTKTPSRGRLEGHASSLDDSCEFSFSMMAESAFGGARRCAPQRAMRTAASRREARAFA